MSEEKATIVDLKKFFIEFTKYRLKYKYPVAYPILREILNWLEKNQIDILPVEVLTKEINPKIWPKKIPEKPSTNYNQAIDKYLNPVSEILYIVVFWIC